MEPLYHSPVYYSLIYAGNPGKGQPVRK